jgi:hypothetical protein
MLLAGPACTRCSIGITWWQPWLLVGLPFVIYIGLWPQVPVLVGNASLVASVT